MLSLGLDARGRASGLGQDLGCVLFGGFSASTGLRSARAQRDVGSGVGAGPVQGHREAALAGGVGGPGRVFHLRSPESVTIFRAPPAGQISGLLGGLSVGCRFWGSSMAGPAYALCTSVRSAQGGLCRTGGFPAAQTLGRPWKIRRSDTPWIFC